jgi:predicted dehydrogenase
MLKIGIVGTGRVAKGNYLPYLSKRPNTTLLYFSRTKEKADACAAQFGGKVCETPAALVAEQPDAILVLTNEKDRFAAVSALLPLMPRRLFFEKPLVALRGQADVTEDDFHKAKMLMHQAAAAKSETAMVFNYRFFDRIQKARELVVERNFGGLWEVAATVHYACWSHCIDLVLQTAGPLAEISALGGAAERGTMKARDVAAALRFESGAVGTILGSSGLEFKMPLFELTFNYEFGRIVQRDLDGEMEVFDHRTRRRETHSGLTDQSRWDHYRVSFEKSLAAYLESIEKNAPPPVPGLAGLAELQFEAALKRSIAERRPVNVAQEFPLEV